MPLLLLGSPSPLFTPNDPDWIPSLNVSHGKVRTNGEKAKQRSSRNLTMSLNKSQEETTKQHKKVCQPTDLQTEEDFLIESSLLEDADFPLSSTFIDKNISRDSCSAYIQTESVLTENCNQTDMTVNHLKKLENELLDKSKHNYQLHEKVPYLMIGTLEFFDSDQKVTVLYRPAK